ncbi:MAG: hypothetical protein OEZ31_03135, partial [Nitrospirota bacterium]|nr:hypothetical protein [Nitrospirota bacterium]
TALEAGTGGAQITFQFIGLRGETSATNSLLGALNSYSLNAVITTPITCVTKSDSDCTVIGNYTGIATKFNLPTICWTGCDSLLTIDPLVSTTYDMSYQLPGTPISYNVYAKIADTVLGNSGGDEGLVKGGVVYSTGEVTVVSRPYLYTIEIDAENAANPLERAKLSLLYQY